jgi:hypothetical protein
MSFPIPDPNLPEYFGQQFGYRIQNITTGNNAVITTYGAHNLVNGTPILIQYAKGITNLNGNVYPIIVTGPDTFKIPATTVGTYQGFGTYSIASMANHFLSEEI